MSKKLVRIGHSRHGKGVFALQGIRKGALIFVVMGKRVHWKVSLKWHGAAQNNTIRFGPETYLSPQGEGQYINHSCQPNAYLEKRKGGLCLVASKYIRKGGEVTFDYSTTIAPDDSWTMRCSCGTKRCRKVVRNYTLLPQAVLEKYKHEKMIPAYILRVRVEA